MASRSPCRALGSLPAFVVGLRLLFKRRPTTIRLVLGSVFLLTSRPSHVAHNCFASHRHLRARSFPCLRRSSMSDVSFASNSCPPPMTYSRHSLFRSISLSVGTNHSPATRSLSLSFSHLFDVPSCCASRTSSPHVPSVEPSALTRPSHQLPRDPLQTGQPPWCPLDRLRRRSLPVMVIDGHPV